MIFSKVLILSINSLIKNQAISFILMGIINTLFGYLIFSFFIFIHCNSSLAIFFSTILGIGFNFNTLGRYVFNKFNKNLIIKFISIYMLLMVLNITLQRTINIFIASDYVSGLFSIVTIAGLSYILNKYFVFK